MKLEKRYMKPSPKGALIGNVPGTPTPLPHKVMVEYALIQMRLFRLRACREQLKMDAAAQSMNRIGEF